MDNFSHQGLRAGPPEEQRHEEGTEEADEQEGVLGSTPMGMLRAPLRDLISDDSWCVHQATGG